MSTIEPEVIEGGSRIDGNSICFITVRFRVRSFQRLLHIAVRISYQSFVLCQQDRNASVDFPDSERNEHGGREDL